MSDQALFEAILVELAVVRNRMKRRLPVGVQQSIEKVAAENVVRSGMAGGVRSF